MNHYPDGPRQCDQCLDPASFRVELAAGPRRVRLLLCEPHTSESALVFTERGDRFQVLRLFGGFSAGGVTPTGPAC